VFERRACHDSYVCRRGKGSHAAIHRAQAFARRWLYVLKCNVRRFFASVNHKVLRALLRRVLKDRAVLALHELQAEIRRFLGDRLRLELNATPAPAFAGQKALDRDVIQHEGEEAEQRCKVDPERKDQRQHQGTPVSRLVMVFMLI